MLHKYHLSSLQTDSQFCVVCKSLYFGLFGDRIVVPGKASTQNLKLMSITQSAQLSKGMEKRAYAAATSGNVDALTKLQDNGQVNVLREITPTRNTALHLAAYHGHVQVVKKLLQVMNQDIEAGNQTIREFLTARNMEGNTAFHEAAMGGQYKVMEVLLEHDPHLVDIVNNAGETSLFKAAEEGHKRIVEKLLPLTSPQYDRRTSDGQTLLHCAVCNRHKGVIKRLIRDKPYLLTQTDDSQRTVLHNAAYLKQIAEIAKMLLEKDTSLCYQVDTNGQSPLHIAVKEGNVDLVREISNYGKDCLEIVDNDGRNAMHLAVDNAIQIFDRISRRIKTLMLLVISKRLINNPDINGKRPLDIALDNMANDERLFSGVKRLLEKNGARRTRKTVEEEKRESMLVTEKPMWKIQIVSVNAVLIATVAFAAAFTLPGKDSQGHHLNGNFFQTVVICVTLAFCSSIASAILLMYALYGKQEDSLLLQTAIKGLWIALIALLLAFGAAIYVVIVREYSTVAVIVLAMVCVVPIFIRIMIFRSKEYIFREDENLLWTLLIFVIVNIIVFYFIQVRLFRVVLGVVAVLTMAWIRRTFWGSKQHISRDHGLSRWFIIIGLIVNGGLLLLLV